MFNCQQFSRLADYFDVRIVVPVSFIDWFGEARKTSVNNPSGSVDYQGPERWLFPYFFTPRILRALYPLMMRWSVRWQLFSRIKQFAPDYILGSWLYPDGVVAADMARELQVPYILKAHGSDINVYLDNTARGASILRACREAKSLVVVSQALKTILVEHGIASDAVDVLYNGVDAQRFFPQSMPAKRSSSLGKKLLFVGNLKHDKGVMELLQAFSALDNRNYQLTIVGDGVMRNEMQRFVETKQLQQQVFFTGSIPHSRLPELMRDADILVLPSYREGVPNVILEAMACGLPVVATDVGGIPEIIQPMVNGLLVPARNVDALRMAMLQALTHNWDIAAIVERSRQFSWSSNIERLQQLIVRQNGGESNVA